MKSFYLFLMVIFIACGVLFTCGKKNQLVSEAQKYFQALPGKMISGDNPITPEKTKLGKMLFYDTRFSIDRTTGCFKCHWMNLYGTDGLRKSIGNNYRLNPRNAPTVLNSALQISQHWIGNRKSVEDQAQQALLGHGSFGLESYEQAEAKLNAIPGYPELFQTAFPNDSVSVTARNFGLAIGAWERTLVTPSRFDQLLEGHPNALTEKEQRGLKTFMDTGCKDCHNGVLVGGGMYEKFGITEPYWNLTGSAEIDSGRYLVTHDSADLFVFKVPPLRNVGMTSPYFMDGSVASLHRVVPIMAKLQLGKEVTADQVDDIVAFLNSLTGRISTEAREVPLSPAEQSY
jgi:cytochrome c peroxidase